MEKKKLSLDDFKAKMSTTTESMLQAKGGQFKRKMKGVIIADDCHPAAQ